MKFQCFFYLVLIIFLSNLPYLQTSKFLKRQTIFQNKDYFQDLDYEVMKKMTISFDSIDLNILKEEASIFYIGKTLYLSTLYTPPPQKNAILCASIRFHDKLNKTG